MTTSKDAVLITGCNGLIGSATMRQLKEKYRIVGFDIEESDQFPDDGIFCKVDLTSETDIENGLNKVRNEINNEVRSVIHLAAYYDFSGDPSPLYEEITVKGTEKLLKALQQLNVRQFIFSSTMLVHAPTKPGQPINEDCVLEPKWDYPKSKVKTEQLLREQRKDIPKVLLRVAGVYDDYCNSLPLAHQIQRIKERHITGQVYPGSLDCGQAFLHIDDLTNALQLLVQRAGKLPEELPLLVGEPETISYGELQKELGKLIHGEEWTTQQVPKSAAKTGAWLQDNLPLGDDPFIKPWMIDMADDHYELDISRAANTLIWSPNHSLRETLPKMIKALNEDPFKWYNHHGLTISEEIKESSPSQS